MIPYTLNEKSLTFFSGGKQTSISRDHPFFDEILVAVRAQDIDVINELLNIKSRIEKLTIGRAVVYDDDTIEIDGKPVSKFFAETFLDYYRQDPESVKPLIEFAVKLSNNPDKDVRDDLFEWLNRGNMPLYVDGNFMAFKVVKLDYTPYASGEYGRDQSIGKVVTQPRHTCNPDRNITCASGLHFCSYEYLPVFGSGGENCRVIVLTIDPRNVVAIPTDYNLSKGRCCEFYVQGEVHPDAVREIFGGRITITEEEIAAEHPDEKSNDPEVITKDTVLEVIHEHEGNKSAAARALGISRSRLYRLIQ